MGNGQDASAQRPDQQTRLGGRAWAIVASARKLAILFWCMLTRGEDYAHQQPSLTNKKLRRLEITAGAPKYARSVRGIWSTNAANPPDRAPARAQAEASYKRMVTDQQAGTPARKWARARHRSSHGMRPSTRSISASGKSACIKPPVSTH